MAVVAIMVPGLSNPMVAGRIADNVLEVLRGTGERSDAAAPISTSIGIAICPDDATDRQTLLSHADTALYRAKNEGRGIYRFFEASMGEDRPRISVAQLLVAHAVPGLGELRLVYQPQKDIRSDKVAAIDPMLRWKPAARL